jgi:hypothetical protein
VASSGLLVDIGFSDADVERARLLRVYALHQSSPDAERLANLHHAHARAAQTARHARLTRGKGAASRLEGVEVEPIALPSLQSRLRGNPSEQR